MTIELSTLGRLAVTAGGQQQAGITAQPVRAALLVYLAVERTVSRDAALACLWPDQEASAARHALSQTLYQIRRDLGNEWLDAPGTYLRVTPRLTADATSFTDAVESGRYDDALELYRGPFLDGCHLASTTTFQHWVDRHRGRLARLHRKARREAIAQRIPAGDGEAALRIARRWVEIEPLEDEAQQHLIRLLADAGARAEALRQYADFVRILQIEDLEPLPETAALADRIREGDVAPAGSASPAAAAAPLPAAGPQETTNGGRVRRRWALPLTGVAAVALGLTAVLLDPLSPTQGGSAGQRSIRSVAVLPFENLTADSAEDYFVDGMHEALIADLSRVSDLRVISRTSVLRYRGTSQDIPAIARELNVDGVIEGSVFRAGDSVRIQASLIDAAADAAVGTVTYVRDLHDVLGLLRDAARGIAVELAAATTRTQDPMPPSRLVNPAAYEAYLRARHLVHDFRGDSWREATVQYERAIALDSGFAQAYAGLAQTHFLLGFFRVESRGQSWPRAREMALRAVGLDGRASEAHTVLGYVALYDDWDWDGAEKALLEALRLDPNDALARHAYADLLTVLGRPEEGLRQVELGRGVDPLSPLVNAPVVGHLFVVGRFEAVLSEIRRLRALLDRPAYGQEFVGASLWQLERYDEAVREFETLWSSEPSLLEAVERANAEGGPRAAMRAAADYDARRWNPAQGDAYAIASAYARARAATEALDWLDQAYRDRLPGFLHAVKDPTFDALRSDSRFRTLMRRAGVPSPDTWAPAAEERR